MSRRNAKSAEVLVTDTVHKIDNWLDSDRATDSHSLVLHTSFDDFRVFLAGETIVDKAKANATSFGLSAQLYNFFGYQVRVATADDVWETAVNAKPVEEPSLIELIGRNSLNFAMAALESEAEPDNEALRTRAGFLRAGVFSHIAAKEVKAPTTLTDNRPPEDKLKAVRELNEQYVARLNELAHISYLPAYYNDRSTLWLPSSKENEIVGLTHQKVKVPSETRPTDREQRIVSIENHDLQRRKGKVLFTWASRQLIIATDTTPRVVESEAVVEIDEAVDVDQIFARSTSIPSRHIHSEPARQAKMTELRDFNKHL